MTPNANQQTWDVVFQSQKGVGDWDVKGGILDRCIAYDYDGSGYMDHLLAFRRKTGQVWILKKAGAQPKPPLPSGWRAFTSWPPPIIPQPGHVDFAAVYQTTTGLPGFDLADSGPTR